MGQIFAFAIVVIGLYSLWQSISFQSTRKSAKRVAQELSETKCVRVLNAKEMRAMSDVYDVEFSGRKLFKIEGSIHKSSLQVDGVTSEPYYLMNGAKIELPLAALESVREQNIAYCVYCNGALYAFAFNDYMVTHHQAAERRRSKDRVALNELITEERQKAINKIRELRDAVVPMEKVSSRGANEVEQLLCRNMVSNSTYFIIITISGLFAIAISEGLAPEFTLLFLCLVAACVLVMLWRARIAKKNLVVTTVKAQIAEIHAPNKKSDLGKVELFNTKYNDKLTVYGTKNTLQLLTEGNTFQMEVEWETKRILTVDGYACAEFDMQTQIVNKKHHWGIAAAWIFSALIMLSMINFSALDAAIRNKLNPKIVQIHSLQDLNSAALKTGDIVTISGYRYCKLKDPDSSNKYGYSYNHYDIVVSCQPFVYGDKPLSYTMDKDLARYAQLITDWEALDLYPRLDKKRYDYMKSMYRLLYRNPLERLASRSEIIALTTNDLKPIAKFVDEYCDLLDECNIARREVIAAWQVVTKQQCHKQCWKQILTAQKTSKEAVFLESSDDFKFQYLLQIKNDIKDKLRAKFVDQANQFDGLYRIRFISPSAISSKFDSLFYSSNQTLNLTELADEFKQLQVIKPTTGFIQQITQNRYHTDIVINNKLTMLDLERMIYRALGILLMVIFCSGHLTVAIQAMRKPKLLSEILN